MRRVGRLGVTETARPDGDYLFAMEGNPRGWRATGKSHAIKTGSSDCRKLIVSHKRQHDIRAFGS